MEDSTTSSRSSPITFTSTLAGDPQLLNSSASNSASNSLQADGGVLNSSDPTQSVPSDAEFGFQRPEMRSSPLVGTVQIYDRHLFLCYKTPQVWPAHVEAAEFDRLPRLLAAALKARKGDIKKRTRLTICEGEDGTESSNGDVLIFPDMIRYRRLTHFDVENFVEDVLVKETEWLPGAGEVLTGSYIFVCSHGSRDRRCGVCGPVLIKKFKDEISSHGLQGKVSVSACSHIGGHKYAGNVIIFSRNGNGEVTGHWYGYVAPEDVSVLLEQHIGKGEIIDHLWRGQMGLSEEEQQKAQELRLQLNGKADEGTANGSIQATGSITNGTTSAASSCCQTRGNFSCCQNGAVEDKIVSCCQNGAVEDKQDTENMANPKSKNEKKSTAWKKKKRGMPAWVENWEREDTYAALAVAAAVASIAVAYSFYRQSK